LAFRDNGSSAVRSSSQTNLTVLPTTWTTGKVWSSSSVSAYASAAASPQPVLSVSPSSLIFTAVENGVNPSPATLTASNTGSGILNFTGKIDSMASSTATGGSLKSTRREARLTEAIGINDQGQIVGTFNDAVGSHGFLDTDGTFTTIGLPAYRMDQ
jgi:probable HAF family extracellular repeat protein